jgi:lysyl-tRNA synthetase class 2
MSNRKMGKVFFADLRDSTERLQIYVRKDDVGEASFKLFDMVDLGDIVGCEGTLFVTKTGERTLRVSSFELLTKSLHPLPDKHSGLTDKETRYRRRYADLIVNPEVRETFRRRTRIIQIVRDFLNGEGFLEVETPILKPLYGDASAPFRRTARLTSRSSAHRRRLLSAHRRRLRRGWEFCKDFTAKGSTGCTTGVSVIELCWAYADANVSTVRKAAASCGQHRPVSTK